MMDINDALAGDQNNNIFRGRGGDDAINGRDGLDTADYRSDATAAIIVNLDSIATVTGDASVGTDTLTGIERVLGSRFNDTFVASAGFNSGGPAGQSAFNVFRGGAGDDAITGNGFTRIEYTGAKDGVRVDLGAGEGRGINLADASDVGVDAFAVGSVFEVRGSAFNDILLGSNLKPAALQESFIGDAGDDTIDGRLGALDIASYITSTSGVFASIADDTANDGFGGMDLLLGI